MTFPMYISFMINRKTMRFDWFNKRERASKASVNLRYFWHTASRRHAFVCILPYLKSIVFIATFIHIQHTFGFFPFRDPHLPTTNIWSNLPLSMPFLNGGWVEGRWVGARGSQRWPVGIHWLSLRGKLDLISDSFGKYNVCVLTHGFCDENNKRYFF